MLQIVNPSYGVFELVCTDGTVLRRIKLPFESIRACATAGYILRECADALPTAFSRELTPSTLLNKDLGSILQGYNADWGSRYASDVRDVAPDEFKKWAITDRLELETQSMSDREDKERSSRAGIATRPKPDLPWLDTRTARQHIQDMGSYAVRDPWVSYTNWAYAPK